MGAHGSGAEAAGQTGNRLNADIADKLDEMAALLEQQREDGFRVRAYRNAARTLRALARPVDAILDEEGVDGLVALPDVGRRIGAAIAEMVGTGQWMQLQRVSGALDPVRLFQSLPGIGPRLAERICGHLQVDTLEALEIAAHDGRLAQVPGIGSRRAAAIRAVLAERLGRRRIRATGAGGLDLRMGDATAASAVAPDVLTLLDVDAQYRAGASAGALPVIAPRRFNPDARAWLPVLHTRRGDWDFTALFSNTARAHELGRTHDWVVIYAHRHSDDSPELQFTVVTETHGPLLGTRVVRGREAECGERCFKLEGTP